jgi:hypothetical protein
VVIDLAVIFTYGTGHTGLDFGLWGFGDAHFPVLNENYLQ